MSSALELYVLHTPGISAQFLFLIAGSSMWAGNQMQIISPMTGRQIKNANYAGRNISSDGVDGKKAKKGKPEIG